MAEHWRIDAFELWCWRRLFWVPWTARRSKQSVLKETSPGCPLEGLMLRLKLQYFGHLTWRVDSLEKTLVVGGIGGRRRREWQRMRWLDGITDLMYMSLGELQQVATDGEAWHAAIHGGRKRLGTTECLNWTDLMADSRWVLSENSKILCLALFGTPKLNLSVEFQSTITKRTSFGGVNSWRSYCSS